MGASRASKREIPSPTLRHTHLFLWNYLLKLDLIQLLAVNSLSEHKIGKGFTLKYKKSSNRNEIIIINSPIANTDQRSTIFLVTDISN